jgi:hypothetical protein
MPTITNTKGMATINMGCIISSFERSDDGYSLRIGSPHKDPNSPPCEEWLLCS